MILGIATLCFNEILELLLKWDYAVVLKCKSIKLFRMRMLRDSQTQ